MSSDKAPFSWEDPFQMQSQFSEEERMIQESARDYAQDKLLSRVRDAFRHETFDREIMNEFGAMGMLGATLPEKYGCSNVNYVAYGIMAREVEMVDSGYRSAMSVQSSLVMHPIYAYGTEAQREKYLPKLATGEIIGSFALTEPDAGSDAGSLQTKAIRDGDDFILNGTKRYITNAPSAQLFTVFARTDADLAGAKGVSAFLVDASTPGITLGAPNKKMGQKGAHVCDVIFDDCRIPASCLLGGADKLNKGFLTAMKTLDRGRIHISALSVGCADRLIDLCLAYGSERKQFGQRIADFQLLQAMVADSKAESYAAQCMVLDAAKRRDNGEAVNTLASCCKLFATEMVGRVADRAVQYHGGAGYMEEYAVARFYKDVRLFRIYEGTSQIQQTIIAKNLLKEFN